MGMDWMWKGTEERLWWDSSTRGGANFGAAWRTFGAAMEMLSMFVPSFTNDRGSCHTSRAPCYIELISITAFLVHISCTRRWNHEDLDTPFWDRHKHTFSDATSSTV